jgi:hypothetical protein
MGTERYCLCARETGAAAWFRLHAAGPPRAAKGNDGDSGRLIRTSVVPYQQLHSNHSKETFDTAH